MNIGKVEINGVIHTVQWSWVNDDDIICTDESGYRFMVKYEDLIL